MSRTSSSRLGVTQIAFIVQFLWIGVGDCMTRTISNFIHCRNAVSGHTIHSILELMRIAHMDRMTAIRLFVRLVECGSFSAVGREEGIGQPAVSKQIGALER